jgi:hypothetical protein
LERKSAGKKRVEKPERVVRGLTPDSTVSGFQTR